MPVTSLVMRNPILCGDTKAVGDAVDIGVVADHFSDIENVSVSEFCISQSFDICWHHLTGSVCELQRIGEHRTTLVRHRRAAPVDFELRKEGVVFEESAQTAPVMADSIVTVVLERNHVRNQLSLHLAKCCGAGHG